MTVVLMDVASGYAPVGSIEAETPRAHTQWERRALRRADRLGWFSVCLGLAQLVAPRRLASFIGLRDDRRRRRALRALGTRELASGVGLLTRARPAGWAWMRVAGDLMDLALLGRAMRWRRSRRGRVLAAAAAVAGVTAVDAWTAGQLSRGRVGRTGAAAAIDVNKSVTVNASPEAAYRLWRDLENVPRFFSHIESVIVSDGRSRWRARAPAGTVVEWDAVIVEDRVNEILSWRSVEGSEVETSGSIRFVRAPGGRGTEVHVELRYVPLGGKLGAFFAQWFGANPGRQIAGDLRRFKQVLETGEVVHSDASIHRGMHPARPWAPSAQEVSR